MKKARIIPVLALLLLLAIGRHAFAQDAFPRFEVFGGFSYLPADSNDYPRDTSYGFQTSITGNFTRWLGVAVDLGGQYGSNLFPPPLFGPSPMKIDTTVYEYGVGPRFTLRRQRASVFAHALLGGASGRTSIGRFSDSELLLGLGGGVDIPVGGVGSSIAIRAAQFDFLSSFTDMLENNVRVGAGIVFKLGGR